MSEHQTVPLIAEKEIERLRRAFFAKTSYDREIEKYRNGFFAIGVLKKSKRHYDTQNIMWLNIVVYDFEVEKLVISNYFMTREEVETMGRLLINIASCYGAKRGENGFNNHY